MKYYTNESVKGKFKTKFNALRFIIHNFYMNRWIVFVKDEIKLCINPLCTLLMSSSERVRVDVNDINFNAPEFLENGKISLKYDIWSMGWLLFHMTTLENPFDYLQEPGNFTKLSLHTQYSTGLRHLFKNMIDLNPEKRLSCDEILEDRIFLKYKYHFDKPILCGTRFKLLTVTDTESSKIRLKFPLQAFDTNDKKNIKNLKRQLKLTSTNFMKLMAKSDYIHPNLTMFETMFEEDDFLYTVESPLAMSLNTRLEKVLETKDSITSKVRQIFNWFISLCDAVDYLHSLNVIHGNICTGMIGFDQNDTIKLKFNENSFLIRSHNDLVPINDTSSLALNSPELLNTENAFISTKYDVYCLGWLLYTMCKLKDISHDLKVTKNFNQLKVIPELPTASYPSELNSIFKEMINIDYKKRPTIKRILENQFVVDNRVKKKTDTQTVEKESTFSEKRYEKMNILTRDDICLTYLVVDNEENLKK